MVDIQGWLAQQAQQKKRLYERYGKALEEEHTGEYVAISVNGQTILGTRMGKVLRQAVETFGRGNFVMARVGHETLAEWLRISR